jgi:hypothetical protein
MGQMWRDSDSGQMGFRAGWQIEPSAGGREGSAKAELGRSRMGQSPCPGSKDLYPLSVSVGIICPSWLKLKRKCWIAWGLAEPWVVKRFNRVLRKQGPKLRVPSAVLIVRDRVLRRRNNTRDGLHRHAKDEATPLTFRCVPKRRFRAGLHGGMVATGVPPSVHGTIPRGSGIQGTRGLR